MKLAVTTLIVFLSVIVLGQKGEVGEAVTPPGTNHVLIERSKQAQAKNVDGLFVYTYATRSFPAAGVKDDFSTNLFKPLTAQPGDPEVTDTVWFHLYRAGVPDTMGTEYMNDTTYRYTVDTVTGYGFDSLTFDTIPIPWVSVDVYDLCSYPPTFITDTLWPNESSIDSLWTLVSPDVPFSSPTPAFEQDSVTVYKVDTTLADLDYFWIDNFVYHNYTYAILPPSLGVVSFDGLDETGYPYDFNTTGAGLADVLTSVPFDLGGTIASDSVGVSFFYQTGGFGESPESTDSLVLQFYSPSNDSWTTTWKQTGFVQDTFKRAIVKVNSPAWWESGFQFRFKSYGALNGGLDVWHLDYVEMKKFNTGTAADTIIDDVAYVYPSNGILANYTSMPWTHYKFDSINNMIDSIQVLSHNLRDAPKNLNFNNCLTRVYHESSASPLWVDTVISSSVNFNAGEYKPLPYEVADNTIPFWYDPGLEDSIAYFTVEHTLNSTTTDLLRLNDTIRYTQRLTNYYSYDDGTAEGAYGVTGTQPKLAYRFTTPIADSIFAVKIHFEPSVNDVTTDPFFLMVWDNSGPGGTPGAILYEEPLLNSPIYNEGPNGFHTYYFSEKVGVNGTFYIGWKQTTTDRLNVGFDANIDNQDKIYYDVTGGTWANTSFQGSLMIRPMFDAAQPTGWVSVNEVDLEAKVYPNPAQSVLNIVMPEPDSYEYTLLDLNGRLLQTAVFNHQTQVDINAYQAGLYVLKVSDNLGNFTTVKVIKN